MRTLVTGGGGFLGLYLVEQLLAAGHAVRVLARGEYPRLRELQVEQIRADIRDASAVSTACQQIDCVFHVAAVTGVWGPWSHFYSINTQGTLNVLAGCQAHGVGRLVYTSSPSVVFDGRDHLQADESLPYPERYLCYYPQTKALAEQAVLQANGQGGLATTALRPHLIWGPRDNQLIPRLIQRARQGRLRQVGPGDNLISMAYVENVAAAHLAAADRLTLDSPVAGRAYFINEPQPVRLWDWINTLLGRAGLPPVKKKISRSLAYAIGVACETAWCLLRRRDEPPMTRFLALQLGQSHTYSIARAEQDFGYRSAISVETGLSRLEPELRQLAGLGDKPGA